MQVRLCLIIMQYHFARTARDMGDPEAAEYFAIVESAAASLEQHVVAEDKTKKKLRKIASRPLDWQTPSPPPPPPTTAHCCDRGNDCCLFQMFAS